ncbi:uncharacterized protein EAF01_008017 [Botrytis porri]|uniref:Uncharacterized protein n=1 Tax=Botrytis porri TaxID=87229 RepID=A0A4Z1KQP1_9HELO|nr:uncharacterized protein EAF01_008017 [Botrytis porri]KAF7900715.1 hypothetical protein EAF01_008017 [Botrytis porri]TGO83805.1 hypothetical protein BPOR_0591g00090 [Botrytis porri]
MLSTSDALALIFGVVSAALAGIAIFMARKARVMMNDVIDIEAHPLVAGSHGDSTIGKRQGGNNEAIEDLLKSIARLIH